MQLLSRDAGSACIPEDQLVEELFYGTRSGEVDNTISRILGGRRTRTWRWVTELGDEWGSGSFKFFAGGGGDGEIIGSCLVLPPGVFLGVVAGSAESGCVGPLCFSALGDRSHVIGVLDRGVAPRSPADIVTEDDHTSQQTTEGAFARVHADQLSCVR